MRFRFVSVLLMGGLMSAVGLIPSSSADAAKKRGYESGSQA
jgi:NADH:ubiquinone oxidoreductase subunit 3 (subunit A)